MIVRVQFEGEKNESATTATDDAKATASDYTEGANRSAGLATSDRATNETNGTSEADHQSANRYVARVPVQVPRKVQAHERALGRW